MSDKPNSSSSLKSKEKIPSEDKLATKRDSSPPKEHEEPIEPHEIPNDHHSSHMDKVSNIHHGHPLDPFHTSFPETLARREHMDDMLHRMIQEEDNEGEHHHGTHPHTHKTLTLPSAFFLRGSTTKIHPEHGPNPNKGYEVTREFTHATFPSLDEDDYSWISPDHDDDDMSENAGGMSSYAKKRRKTLRMRGISNVPYVFKRRTITGDVDDDEDENPIQVDVIKRSVDQRMWMRDARSTLPSFSGIEVDGTGQILNAFDLSSNKFNKPKQEYRIIKNEVEKIRASGASWSLADPYFNSNEENPNEILHDRKSFRMAIEEAKLAGVSFDKKLKLLRNLADHLSEKRIEKRDLINEANNAHTTLKRKSNTFRHKMDRIILKVNANRRDLFQRFKIWERSINEIQGKFGFTVASYFRWLRTILYFNIFYSIASFCLVIGPELFTPSQPPTFNFVEDSCLVCSTGHKAPCLGLGHGICNRSMVYKIPKKKVFQLKDLIFGDGSLERSIVYYSGYTNTHGLPECPPQTHNNSLPTNVMGFTTFRFHLLLLFVFVVNSLFIAAKITHYYTMARIETKVPGLTKKNQYNVVLCSWDFSCRDEMAAKSLRKNIWKNLKEIASILMKVEDQNFLVKKLSKSYRTWGSVMMRHCMIEACAMIICIVSGFIVYYSFEIRNLLEMCPESALWILLALPSITISILVPSSMKIFYALSRSGSWFSLRNKNYAIGIRLCVLYLTIVGVIYGHWAYNVKTYRDSICHEEIFGQELYRIVVFQGLLDVVLGQLLNFCYHFYKIGNEGEDYHKPMFDLLSGALSIFFLQTISGIGVFFCPLLPIFVSIRLILTFYSRKFTLIKLSSYPIHLSHMSEIGAPYLAFFMVSYFVTSILNVIIIAEMYPSEVCGPFSHFGDHLDSNVSVVSESMIRGHYYDVFKDITSTTSVVLSALLRPGVAIVIIIILISICYCFHAWGHGYVSSMLELHEILQLERSDRDFLLRLIYNYAKKASQVGAEVTAINLAIEETENEMSKQRRFSTMANDRASFHVTYNKRKLDKWLALFLQSSRSTRRGAVEESPSAIKLVIIDEEHSTSNKKSLTKRESNKRQEKEIKYKNINDKWTLYLRHV